MADHEPIQLGVEFWVKVYAEDNTRLNALSNALNSEYACAAAGVGGLDYERPLMATVRFKCMGQVMYAVEAYLVEGYEDNGQNVAELPYPQQVEAALNWAVQFVADELSDTAPDEWWPSIVEEADQWAVFNPITGQWQDKPMNLTNHRPPR